MDDEQRQVLDDMAKMQDVLRVACRQAIEDGEFRGVFTEDAAIEAQWPA